jgi:hypothetical protein
MFLRHLLRGTALMAATSLPFLCASPKHEVYIWGNGVYQARPDALLQFRNFTPKRITNLPHDLVRLEFGEYYEAGLDAKGGLWIWKAQTVDSNLENASSGLDHERQEVQLLAKDITDVKFTTGYIWAVSSKGTVLQYPIVKDIQEGSVRGARVGKPREVEPLRGSSQIATGCTASTT